MNMEDICLKNSVKSRNTHDVCVINICETVDNTVNNTDGSESDENQTNLERRWSYGHFKKYCLRNVYRSSTIPVEVGGLSLSLVDDGSEISSQQGPSTSAAAKGTKVAWIDDPFKSLDVASLKSLKRRSSGSFAEARNVNHSNVSAVIRRRQKRHKLYKAGRGGNLSYLKYFLCILYYMGVSPYHPAPAYKPRRAFAMFLKVANWTIVSVAVLETLWELKMKWIEFQIEPRMQSLAYLGIALTFVITRIYVVKRFAGMRKQMDRLLATAQEESTEAKNFIGETTYAGPKFNACIAALLGVSVCMAVGSVLFGDMPLHSWSFEHQQRFTAYQANEFTSVWTPNNWKNVTAPLFKKYVDDNLSLTMITFALISDTVRYIGNFYDHVILDFWLALAYQVYNLQLDLSCFLDNTTGSTNPNDLAFSWDLFMESCITCEHIDEIFGVLLKLVHVTNILRLSEFLLHTMELELSAWRLCRIVDLMKIGLTYWSCKMAADTNSKMQKHVAQNMDQDGLVEIRGFKVKVYTLRVEMDHNQIGLGRGNFLVEETFLIKMLCAAWSVFALFADHSATNYK